MKKYLTLLIAMFALAGTLAQAQIVKKEGAFRCGGWNDDFRQLRDLQWDMEELDLSEADCDSIRQNALHSRHKLKKLILPNKLRIIGSQAFFACDGIENLTIPAGTERIESRAFGNCTGLKTLTMLATTPPQLAEDAFSGVDMSSIEIIVPKGTKSAYKKAPHWSRFFKKEKTVMEQCPTEYAIIPVPNSIAYDHFYALSTKDLGEIIAPASLANEQEHLKKVLSDRLGTKNFKKSKRPITLAIDSSIGGKDEIGRASCRERVLFLV